MDKARKLQRSLYRAAKSQPERRFTLLYDKICRPDVLEEAWRRVKSNGGAAGVDRVSIDEVREYGEEHFLQEIQQELRAGTYRADRVRRVHIPKHRPAGPNSPARNSHGQRRPGGSICVSLALDPWQASPSGDRLAPGITPAEPG